MDKTPKKQTFAGFVVFNVLCVCAATVYLLFLRLCMRLGISVCLLKKLFRIYCPGCGGTRAFFSLIHGDIIGSLLCNPIVLLLIIAFCFYEAVGLFGIFAKKALPNILIGIYRRIPFFLAVCTAVFFILRNIFLIFFGIDPLGDILR